MLLLWNSEAYLFLNGPVFSFVFFRKTKKTDKGGHQINRSNALLLLQKRHGHKFYALPVGFPWFQKILKKNFGRLRLVSFTSGLESPLVLRAAILLYAPFSWNSTSSLLRRPKIRTNIQTFQSESETPRHQFLFIAVLELIFWKIGIHESGHPVTALRGSAPTKSHFTQLLQELLFTETME